MEYFVLLFIGVSIVGVPLLLLLTYKMSDSENEVVSILGKILRLFIISDRRNRAIKEKIEEGPDEFDKISSTMFELDDKYRKYDDPRY